MKISKLFLISISTLLSIHSFAQCAKDYELFWSDEFDGTAVNTNNWGFWTGPAFNEEVQYYQPQNASVSNGLLHIKMAKETVTDGANTYNYTSARLESHYKFSFQYGKAEARIKMPNAVGSWPAFWMLGDNIDQVGWPHCGEIDIMEWVGRGLDETNNAISGSIFYDGIWPDNHLSTSYSIPAGQSLITDFHTFAVEWEPNEIRYYCDGHHYVTYKNTSIAPKEWVFNHNFYLILNCAIGGSGGGNVITFNSPENMEVDYVRVYSLPTTADSIILSGPKSLMENTQNVLYKTNYLPNTTYNWSVPIGSTIVDGQGTNAIHVNYTKSGGKIKVSASNTCGPLSDSLAVTILRDTCMIMYDNFDDTINVSYSSSGILTEKYTNPSKDNLNGSNFVGKYQRSIVESYDVLGVNDIALESALKYENKSRVFYMDILTSAPVGTQITLQLENSSLNAGAYPQGRRSNYIGMVAKQNEWHTIKFTFNQIINTATDPNQVDHIAILFDAGNKTGDTYYIDNLRRVKISSDCGTLATAILDPATANSISLYPNPATDILFINNGNDNVSFSIYNCFGEKVIETVDTKADLSKLAKGIYLLKTDEHTLRFVKE